MHDKRCALGPPLPQDRASDSPGLVSIATQQSEITYFHTAVSPICPYALQGLIMPLRIGSGVTTAKPRFQDLRLRITRAGADGGQPKTVAVYSDAADLMQKARPFRTGPSPLPSCHVVNTQTGGFGHAAYYRAPKFALRSETPR